VMLASLPPAEVAEIVQGNDRKLRALQIDPQELIERTETTRRLGYAYAPVGVVQGSRSVAVPVRLADGRTVAGLAVSTITERLPESRVAELVALMSQRAEMIGAQAAEIARRRR
jgi:DNA-binding IclR family transcriptional regulator